MNRIAKKIFAAAALLVLVLFAGTCEEDEGIPTGNLARPDKISYISGNGQSGMQNNRLAQPFIVQVLDSDNNPVPSHKVSFEVTSGGGTMAGTGEKTQEAVTNSSGITSTYMVLGTDSINTVSATSVGIAGTSLSGSPVVFNAFALSSDEPPDTTTNGDGNGGTPPDTTTEEVPEADTIYIVSGNNQTGEVNAIMPLPLVVAVLDKNGELMAGAQITFTVKQGFGRIGLEGSDPGNEGTLTLTSDQDGLAVATLQLGPGPDLDNTVVAEVRRTDGTVVSVSFSAQAVPLPDTANRLVLMSGDNQGSNGEYVVSTLLPLPIVVRVVDSTRAGMAGDFQGAPVSNFPVLFEAFSPSGDGVIIDQKVCPDGCGRLTCLTDEDGLAAVRWTLGTETGGPDSLDLLRNNNYLVAVVVFADGSQDSVHFYATTVPAAAANIAATSSTQLSDIAGTSYTGLGVFVTDQFGNARKGIGISYGIADTPGGGQINQSYQITDINGYASVFVDQLATKVGDMIITASNGILDGSPVTFTITIGPDAPVEMLLADGDGQTGDYGTAFSTAVKVLIFDQYRNGVPDVLVSFQLTGGSASLSPIIVMTDSDGAAESTVIPNAAGNITVTATATISGVPTSVPFNLVATAPAP